MLWAWLSVLLPTSRRKKCRATCVTRLRSSLDQVIATFERRCALDFFHSFSYLRQGLGRTLCIAGRAESARLAGPLRREGKKSPERSESWRPPVCHYANHRNVLPERGDTRRIPTSEIQVFEYVPY